MNAGETIKALLVALKHDCNAKLARAEFLVVFVAILMIVLFVMDAYRLRSNSSFVRTILSILDTVTNPFLSYTIGFLQNLPFNNPFFGIWGVLLYILESGTEYITAYSITDASMLRRTELRELVLTFLAGNLTATKGSQFQGFLWVLWSFGPIMILYKIISYERARNSYSHGRNSKLLVEYMKIEYLKNPEPDPTNMKGYEYIVRGENEQDIDVQAPSYRVGMHVKNERKFITLEKVWDCPGHLLKSLDRKLILKDVCLSYALHKLLRCEMDDLSLPSECHKKTQKLFFKGVLLDEENDKRVFRIMEMQIAFLNDYSYTRLPISVWYGIPLIKCCTLLVTIVIVGLLSVKVHKTEEHQNNADYGDYDYYGNYGNQTENCNNYGNYGYQTVDHIITYALLALIVLKEVWEVTLYILSDWTKLVIICRYVEGSWLLRNRLVEYIILLLCRSNLVMRWHNKMAQYNFVESFNNKPWVKKTLHYGTYMVEKPTEGGKVGKPIKIMEEVKKSIVQALGLLNIDGGDLTNGMPLFYKRRVRDSYQWACRQETCCHLILVWHIATSMCEIQLYEELRVERPWLNSLLHKLKVCWSHRNPFLVDLERLEGRTRVHYIVANSISRYCAYLLVSVPELLPDHVLVSESVFNGTVSDARSFLGGCDSLQSVLKVLKNVEGTMEEGIEGRTIVDKGAILGRALLTDEEMNVEARWEMLANFWVDLLLFLAPSIMTEDHRSHLLEGGEFITLLWALFTNCGIFKRTPQKVQVMAQEDPVPANDGPDPLGGEEGLADPVPANDGPDPLGGEQGLADPVPENDGSDPLGGEQGLADQEQRQVGEESQLEIVEE